MSEMSIIHIFQIFGLVIAAAYLALAVRRLL